jgi:hypothetical protein
MKSVPPWVIATVCGKIVTDSDGGVTTTGAVTTTVATARTVGSATLVATTWNVPELFGAVYTVFGLQATTAAMGNVQKQLSGVLRELTDRDSGVAARVESANRHVVQSLERRTKALDELMHEFKTDLLRIWIPLATSATLLIGLFVGMEIQGCRDLGPATVDQSPMSSFTPSAPTSVEAPTVKAYGQRTNGSASKRDQHVGK